MKKLIGILLLITAATACKQAEDYKKVRDEVMTFHDIVMGDEGRIVKNQFRVKALLKDLKGLKAQFPDVDTLKEREVMTGILKDLNNAEESMNDWMHQFEPDITGKSNEAAVLYFKQEKAKVADLDSVFKAQLKSSDAYLGKFKK